MSGHRANEDGLKTCIVHNTLASRCQCPTEVSQADVHRRESMVNGPLGGLFYYLPPEGIDPNDPGPFIRVDETTRTDEGLTTKIVIKKVRACLYCGSRDHGVEHHYCLGPA